MTTPVVAMPTERIRAPRPYDGFACQARRSFLALAFGDAYVATSSIVHGNGERVSTTSPWRAEQRREAAPATSG